MSDSEDCHCQRSLVTFPSGSMREAVSCVLTSGWALVPKVTVPGSSTFSTVMLTVMEPEPPAGSLTVAVRV